MLRCFLKRTVDNFTTEHGKCCCRAWKAWQTVTENEKCRYRAWKVPLHSTEKANAEDGMFHHRAGKVPRPSTKSATTEHVKADTEQGKTCNWARKVPLQGTDSSLQITESSGVFSLPIFPNGEQDAKLWQFSRYCKKNDLFYRSGPGPLRTLSHTLSWEELGVPTVSM